MEQSIQQNPQLAKFMNDPDFKKLYDMGFITNPQQAPLQNQIQNVLTQEPQGKTIPMAQPQQQQSMTIPQGATLSGLAQQYGTTIQELQRLNPQIINPNLIFAGAKLNLPQGVQQAQPQQIDPKQQAAQITEQANQASEQLFEQIKNRDIDERQSQGIVAQIAQTLAQAPKAPQMPSMMELFTQTRQQLGIGEYETRLAEIDTELERLQVGSMVDQERAGNRPVSQRQIDLRKNTIGKEAQLQQSLLQVERSAVARLADNKLSSLKMIMDFTQQDFQNASKQYEQEWNRNVQMLDLFVKLEDREWGIEKEGREMQDKVRKDAQAQIQTVTNLMKDSGKSLVDMTPDQRRQFDRWELEAGFPSGTFEAFGDIKPNAKVLHTSSGTDAQGNGVVTFIYEDPENPGRPGVVEVVKTGTQATQRATGTSAGVSMTATERRAADVANLKDSNAVRLYMSYPAEFKRLWNSTVVNATQEFPSPKKSEQAQLTEAYNNWVKSKEKDSTKTSTRTP